MDTKKLLIIILVILLICVFCACAGVAGYLIFFRDKGDGTSTNTTATSVSLNQTAAETPQPGTEIPTPIPLEPTISPEQQRWLVMVYQDADDDILEYDIYFDMNEIEVVGSSDRVNIVSQLDRYSGSFEGDGNWTTAKRFYVTQNSDLDYIYSLEISDLGEADMGMKSTLVDFATWAIITYPADRYVLILSDHGAGWNGGFSDMDSDNLEGLKLSDIDAALGDIIAQTGIKGFDIIGFDACLMAQIEVFTALAPHARIAIASEEVIPSIGWAYAGFLNDLVQNPAMSPENLARTIVNSYIYLDQRVVNDEQRQAFLERNNYTYDEDMTAEDLGNQLSRDVTLTAVNLEAVPLVNAALNELILELTYVDQAAVARARTYAQSYYSVYGPDLPPSFIDLGNFASVLMEESGNQEVSNAANRLYAAMDQATIAERHGPERPGSTGISIYFPNSELYVNPVSGYDAYTSSANRFVEASQWDDFLAFHYTGAEFSPDYNGPVTPLPGFSLQPPGMGDINMTSLLTSAETIAPGESVHLEAEISGSNIGFVYFFAGKFFPESNSFLAVDANFVLADASKEVNGIVYPDWGGGETVSVAVDWMPNIYYINDGAKNEFAVLYPLYYGATPEQMVYAVDGLYTFAESGEKTYAAMTFGADGWMIKVFSFTPNGGEGPREILPKTGDTFTLLLKSIAMPEQEGSEPEFVEFEGGTLTFSGTKFFWDSYVAEAGQYVAGIGAIDLDGNYTLDFKPVLVQQK